MKISGNKGNIVDEIKDRCNIVDVVGRVVPLKKTGNNHKGLCPFHNEKTPSFVVSETKQHFTCFGCNATGDVFEFVMKYYNLDFQGALERLAKEYNVEIDRGSEHNRKEKAKHYEINREAAIFFYKAFFEKENPALTYMLGRGINYETLKKFGIGYADGEWNSLLSHMEEKGFNKKDLLTLSLVSEKDGRVYDKFRNRVMFPIFNTGGKVIGFGGRILGEGEPKYLNSSESPVFSKKNNLFGLNTTRQDIGKAGKAILVEGYMDVISLYQAGVQNVAASLGTALTESQGKLLKRYTNQVILSYDGDAAGKAAALRGMDILYKEGLKVKVLHLEGSKDPDDFIKENGKTAYLKLTEKALGYVDYKLSLLKETHNLSSNEGKIDFIREAVKVLKEVSSVEAETYIPSIAKDMRLSESAIRMEYSGVSSTQYTQLSSERGSNKANISTQEITTLEKNLLRLMLCDDRYYKGIVNKDFRFESLCGEKIYRAIIDFEPKEQGIDIRVLGDSLDERERFALEDILENIILGDADKVYSESIASIDLINLERKILDVKFRLSIAEGDEEGNSELITELMRELQEMSTVKQTLDQRK